MADDFVTVKEAANIIGIEAHNIRFMLRDGKIPGARKEYDRIWVIPKNWPIEEKKRRENKPDIYKQAKEEGVSPQAIYQRLKRQKMTKTR